MRISRLYVAMALSLHEKVELDEDSAYYLRAVLRLKKGQAISLFNGEGGEFLGQTVKCREKGY